MTAAAPGAWLVFEREAGFSMTPPKARAWSRRGTCPGHPYPRPVPQTHLHCSPHHLKINNCGGGSPGGRSQTIAKHHQHITAETGIPICLYKPPSPWPRGTNESTNRLLRRYLPKGPNFRNVQPGQFGRHCHELNHRLHKARGYYIPAEVSAGLLNSSEEKKTPMLAAKLLDSF